MDTQTLVDNLLKNMTFHDWDYSYNDDFRGWSKSHAQYQEIWASFVELQNVDEKLAIETWNSKAPAHWKK